MAAGKGDHDVAVMVEVIAFATALPRTYRNVPSYRSPFRISGSRYRV